MVFTSKALILAIFASCVLSCSLREDCNSREASAAYERLNSVLEGGESPSEAARAQLLAMTAERRIDLFLYSRYCKDNGTVRNAILLNGGDLAPAIVGRIENSGRMDRKTELAISLYDLDTECGCVHSQPDLMKRLLEEKARLVASSQDRADRPTMDLFLEIVGRLQQRQ